jgi:hypothetical protein
MHGKKSSVIKNRLDSSLAKPKKSKGAAIERQIKRRKQEFEIWWHSGLKHPTAALRSRETRTCPAFEETVLCRKTPSRFLMLATP